MRGGAFCIAGGGGVRQNAGRVKEKRYHPSDLVIPVVVAGLIALLLSRWHPMPRRGADGLFEDAALWPLKDEAALLTLNSTTSPDAWADRAVRLADTYGILGRRTEEAELLKKALTIR